jgi:uncharacterized protein (TIGR03067 family)
MDTRLTIIPSFFAAVCLLFSAPVSGGDLEDFQGEWEIVAVQSQGQNIQLPGKPTLKIEGNKSTSTVNGKTMEVATFKLDEAKTPKTIDTASQAENGATKLGIYQIEGDEMAICVSTKDGERPAEFVTKEGDAHIVLLMLRRKTQ